MSSAITGIIRSRGSRRCLRPGGRRVLVIAGHTRQSSPRGSIPAAILIACAVACGGSFQRQRATYLGHVACGGNCSDLSRREQLANCYRRRLRMSATLCRECGEVKAAGSYCSVRQYSGWVTVQVSLRGAAAQAVSQSESHDSRAPAWHPAVCELHCCVGFRRKSCQHFHCTACPHRPPARACHHHDLARRHSTTGSARSPPVMAAMC